MLEGGALATTLDKNGCHPIAYAMQSKKQECIDLLTTAGSHWPMSESKVDEFEDAGHESDWAQLIDDQTGFPYFYNGNTGSSMWADEYREYKNSKANHRSTPMAFIELKREQSFRKAPPCSPAVQSTRLLREVDTDEDLIAPMKEEQISGDFESK